MCGVGVKKIFQIFVCWDIIYTCIWLVEGVLMGKIDGISIKNYVFLKM